MLYRLLVAISLILLIPASLTAKEDIKVNGKIIGIKGTTANTSTYLVYIVQNNSSVETMDVYVDKSDLSSQAILNTLFVNNGNVNLRVTEFSFQEVDNQSKDMTYRYNRLKLKSFFMSK